MIPTTIKQDLGQREVDRVLTDIEAKIHWEYVKAAEEMKEKFERYMTEQFLEQDEAQRELLNSGKITMKEYTDWRTRKLLIGERWARQLEVLAIDAVHTDNIAMSIIRGHMPEAYAIGHNYGTYMIETGTGIDTSYTLYDRQTIERLWRENPKLLPDPSPTSKTAKLLREHKDLIWNRNHLQSAITQGILQGEPLSQVANRIQSVTDMDERAANRNAATMMTSAQNGGRIDSFKRAESMGIKLKKVWLATLDNRTRDSHALLDGEARETDEKFTNGLKFPGDPNGAPSEIWNCRCTLITQLAGFERDVSDLNLRHNKNLKETSYREWKMAHIKR